MIVWKVVFRYEGQSLSCNAGGFIKPLIQKHIVKYRIKETTHYPLNLGPLMAFENLIDAQEFRQSRNSRDYIILKCRAKKSRKAPSRITSGYNDYSSIKEFWIDGNSLIYDISYPPRGTVWCNSITPLEIVEGLENG